MIRQNKNYITSFFENKKKWNEVQEGLCLNQTIKSFSNDRVDQRKKCKKTKISWAVINDALRFTPVGASLRQIFGLA